MGLGAFVSVGRSHETALQRVELAERLGYESVFTTHIAARDSLTLLMAYAARTERVRIGTGVMPIYSRPPATTAMAAATVDEFSGGRLVLGLGVSHRPVVEGWYGDTIGKPVREMREYVAIVRAILRREPPPEGERFRSGFQFMGLEPRADLPIYVAALSPAMLRAAGEIADGVILWLCNPEYVERVVVPEVTTGLERAGKGLEGFDIVAAVPSAVTAEPDEARAKLRQDLIPYFSLPFYRAMIERSGYEDDIQGFDEGMAAGDAASAVQAISDRFLQSLAGIGSSEEATESLRRYRDSGATSPCVGAVPGTDFNATLEALAGALG
jgi:alkanesulfonate monooxygenase SsuD/methylene tetrahydromethanopterin reductase-like flavin-dependent oxidoreductase (luciferase family)